MKRSVVPESLTYTKEIPAQKITGMTKQTFFRQTLIRIRWLLIRWNFSVLSSLIYKMIIKFVSIT
ncbi:hypothetical protein H8E88_09160 [candidate division KSB1 bacterium]|nr:hypothetical protein [candidate division KSB1 bacterium]